MDLVLVTWPSILEGPTQIILLASRQFCLRLNLDASSPKIHNKRAKIKGSIHHLEVGQIKGRGVVAVAGVVVVKRQTTLEEVSKWMSKNVKDHSVAHYLLYSGKLPTPYCNFMFSLFHWILNPCYCYSIICRKTIWGLPRIIIPENAE